MHLLSTKPSIAAIALLPLIACPAVMASEARENIALHKKATFETKPNYAFCTDSGDPLDLTNGRYSTVDAKEGLVAGEAIWVDKGTVGWMGVKPILFTIDLESVQPISGLSYSTAAGRAGVIWPNAIYVAVSEDKKTWHYLGDLVSLNKGKVPEAKSYTTFRYRADGLKAKGRYISFGVIHELFSFVDEIEVYRDPNAVPGAPAPGPVIPPMRQYLAEMTTTGLARNRMQADLQAICGQIKTSSLTNSQKQALLAKASVLDKRIVEMPLFPELVKTILPLNNLHRDVLAFHGQSLAAQKFPALSIWKNHRYEWLPIVAQPKIKPAPQLSISMLKNQSRSDALLLTNAGTKPMTVKLSLLNAPKANPSWLKLSRVVWTDTAPGVPVADALIPLEAAAATYSLEVPAGFTAKVFATVNSAHLPSGSHQSKLRVRGGGLTSDVPLNVTVSKLAMKKPRFSLGLWDYVEGKGSYGLTLDNRDAAIKMMREYYVDSPWAQKTVLPAPYATDFDAAGQLVKPLNFKALENWVKLWPGATRYCVFLDAKDTFAGAKIDSPNFAPRVGSWAKAISNKMTSLGLRPEQMMILIVDEPYNDVQDAIIAAYARAMKAAAPKLTLFQDPSWVRPAETKIQEAITGVDVLCPDLSVYQKEGEQFRNYYQNLRKQGKELWFYQCSGPIRIYDPQLYYRYQAWHAFKAGATGQGFWSFGDLGGAPTSWHDYAITRPASYAPGFVEKNNVYASVHLEALREGVEDYEELAMLGDFIKKTSNAALRKQAETLRDGALQAVTSLWEPTYKWSTQPSPVVADAQLRKIRLFLEKTL